MFRLLLLSHSVISDSLWLHGLQQARLPCPSLSLGACSNSCLLSWWCHPTLSSSASPFSSCLQSFPASGSFLMSRFFTSGGQSIGASASANSPSQEGWLFLGLNGLISLQSKGLFKSLWYTYIYVVHKLYNHVFLSLANQYLLEVLSNQHLLQ